MIEFVSSTIEHDLAISVKTTINRNIESFARSVHTDELQDVQEQVHDRTQQ
jgi:hypothetical protein